MLRTIIRMTADVITPNDTDFDCYGDPCEPGTGADLMSGWINYDGSEFAVYDNRDDVSFLVLDPDVSDEQIEEAVTSLIGAFESENGLTYYAADESVDFVTGQTSMCAVHVSVEDVTYDVQHVRARDMRVLNRVKFDTPERAEREAERLNNKPVDGTLHVVIPQAQPRDREETAIQ